MRCFVLDIELTVPCGLRGCDLWLDRPDLYNCGRAAFEERQSLTVHQLASLFNTDPSRVKAMIEHALTLLREGLATESMPRRYTLLRNHAQCVVCRRPAVDWVDGWGYCSRTCRDWYPPTLANLEAAYGQPLPTVLASPYTLRRFARSRQRALSWQYSGVYSSPPGWRRTVGPWERPPNLPTARVLARRLRLRGRR